MYIVLHCSFLILILKTRISYNGGRLLGEIFILSNRWGEIKTHWGRQFHLVAKIKYYFLLMYFRKKNTTFWPLDGAKDHRKLLF